MNRSPKARRSRRLLAPTARATHAALDDMASEVRTSFNCTRADRQQMRAEECGAGQMDGAVIKQVTEGGWMSEIL